MTNVKNWNIEALTGKNLLDRRGLPADQSPLDSYGVSASEETVLVVLKFADNTRQGRK